MNTVLTHTQASRGFQGTGHTSAQQHQRKSHTHIIYDSLGNYYSSHIIYN